MRRTLVLFALLFLGRNLHGQYVDLREGGRIRVQTVTHPTWLYARFVSYERSGLRFIRCDSCGVQHVDMPELRRFQASTGHTGRSYALEGALFGAVIGGIVGRQTALRADTHPSDAPFACNRPCASYAAITQGVIIGTVIGTTVGALFRREHWESMAIPGSHREKR